MTKVRLFVKDYDGAIKEIAQHRMKVTKTEAAVIFKDHNEFGDSKVLVPNPSNMPKFEKMKT